MVDEFFRPCCVRAVRRFPNAFNDRQEGQMKYTTEPVEAKVCGCGVLIGVEQCWQEVGTGTAHGGGNPKKAHQEVGEVVEEDVAIVAVVACCCCCCCCCCC